MIGKLFGSKARVKILKLFLLHPDDKFYIRQVSRMLKIQLNSARRELENLEEFGLLLSGSNIDVQKNTNQENLKYNLILNSLEDSKKSEKINKEKDRNIKQDRKYYQVNKNFILFDEIKSLIIKAQILYERDFINKLQKVGKTKLLIFTGFFVNNHNSLVDLFVVGNFNKIRLQNLIKDLEKEIGKEINFTVMGIKEFKYRKDITDVFLYDLLEGKKLVAIDEMNIFN